MDATTIVADMLREGRATANEVRAINDAFRDGVLAERKRCAEVALREGDKTAPAVGYLIAKAIESGQ